MSTTPEDVLAQVGTSVETERPATTTISTIAVQSGNTRIVIALLQSKEWIQLKIQEMHPAMTDIGTNMEEAIELHQQHEKVLEKLQTKQSPVEELLRQADELISTQKPRGEVYSAMAENLGLAWKDLNAQLEQRRVILEQAVAFFTKAKDFGDALDHIQKNLTESYFPDTADLCATVLHRHQEERKAALSCSMHMLNEGQNLQEKLCEVATHSMGDSRPLHMQYAARQTSTFVERYMETLHDRWRHLEALWTQRKLKLEQCLKRCQFLMELSEVQSWLRMKGVEYMNQQNLGDSLAGSEILQHEHAKIEKEAKDVQDSSLRLVRTAEQISYSGHYAAEELKGKAYEVLSECSDFLSVLETRRLLLSVSVAFFNLAQTALNKLDQIEVQLTTSDIPRSSLVSQHAQLATTVDEITSPAIQEGRNLINRAHSHELGVQGVVRKVEELEKRKKYLLDLCTAHQAEDSERASAFRHFNNNYNLLIKWITNNGQGFLQRNRDMGATQATAKYFVDKHETLQNDLRMKGMEVEALLSTVPALVRVGGEDAQDIHQKAENLREQWNQLRILLEKRIRIAQRYLSFHKLATKVTKELDDVESAVKQNRESPLKPNVRLIEEKLLTLQQEILQLNNSGKNFLEDAQKVDDVYLNMAQPCGTVQDILDHIQARKSVLTTQWTNWQNEMSTAKETLIQWEYLVKDSHRVIKCAKELECKMFPVIPRELNRVESILNFLENRMVMLLPQIKCVQQEMESFLKKSDVLCPRDNPQPEGLKMVQELQKMNQAFQKKLTDYQILTSMMTSFFKNFIELEKLIDMQETQFKITTLPNDATKVEGLIHDHDNSKPTVMELFQFTNSDGEQVLKKIHEAEPMEAAIQDEEKIKSVLQLRKKSFELAWEEHKKRLEQHLQFCIFDRDMHQINQQIEDLNAQLSAMKDSYGESLPNAVLTSDAFVQFEKTIEILQVRIQHFVSTAQRMMQDKKVDVNHVHQEIQNMQNKWSTFSTQVSNNRHLIDLSIEYFRLIEESEEWLKEGSRILISIARRSSICKNANDANNLHDEIQNFLNQGRSKQEERIRKISSLDIQLYGNRPHAATHQVTNKNKDMLDSFTVISSELNILTENMKLTEKEKMKENKDKEEMDAALHAAQVEAEAAKAAAIAAQESAKAAEAAAKAIPVMTVQKKEVPITEAIPIPAAPPKLHPPVALHPTPPKFVVLLVDAEVSEGMKYTFECKVEGHPEPSVQWFKDGILAESNPDYQTTYQNGVCTLTIEETFSEDSAKFTCRATNCAGVAETYGSLLVKESRSGNGLIPPHFIKEPSDATVPEGKPHQFDCQVSGNPLPLVSWFKDDICIDNSTDYSMICNNGLCTLRLDEAATDHEGRYTCRAVNQAGQVACSAKLQVLTSLLSERPTFVIPLSNVMARAGQKLRLECSLTGQPEPQVTWLHNSKSLKETRDIKLHFDGHKATLVITEAFPKDAGVYTIVAKNKAGEAVSTCNVSVKGRLPLETSDSEMASDIEPAKPQVKQHLLDLIATEGNKVRMDCIIVGQPEPEVIWYHNGKPVKESDDFQLLFEGDRCTLVIKVAYIEDAGTYKCVAINSGGEASSQCSLAVEPLSETEDKSLYSQKDIILTVEMPSPPKFLRPLKDQTSVEGRQATLECQVTGQTDAIKWFKDGNQLLSSPEHQIRQDLIGISTLTIPCVKATDRGTYSVTAQNKGGEAQSFCSLNVSALTEQTASQAYIYQLPPSFLKYIQDSNVPLGQCAKFESIIVGTPKPKVRWNLQGLPVNMDENHDIGEEGDKYWLTIPKVSKEHGGRYSVVAENNAGVATSSAVLRVEEALIHPSPWDSCYQAQTAQTMVMSKKTTVMKTSTLSSMSEVSDDSALDTTPAMPVTFPVSKNFQSSEVIRKLQPDDTQFIISETIVDLNVLLPPKFTKPVSTAIVMEGEKLLLEGLVEGTPEPNIKWCKENIELHNKPGLSITYHGGRASLYIPKAVESDSGKYSCIASNPAGKATSTAEARVKPHREAPKFVKSLHAGVVKSGARVLMEIEITGIPTPEVKWYRNGSLLRSSPDFRLSCDGNKHSILIPEAFPDDSGMFMAVASNVAGEAKCIADLIVEEDRSPEEDKIITYQELSSVQQKKELFTKISLTSSSTIEPYLPSPMKTPIKQPVAEIAAKPTVPSPPPIPAVSSKVWTQAKPEPFPAPAIMEAPSVQDLPEIYTVEEPPVETSDISSVKLFSEERVPSLPTYRPQSIISTRSESFVQKSIKKFTEQTPPAIPSQEPKKQEVKHVPPKLPLEVAKKPLPPVVQNGIEQKFEPLVSVESIRNIKQDACQTELSTSQTTCSVLSEKSEINLPTPTKFIPSVVPPHHRESDDPLNLPPVWKPGQDTISDFKQSWKPVQPPTFLPLDKVSLASADIVHYRDTIVTPVIKSSVPTSKETSSSTESYSSGTSVKTSFTRITSEETTVTKKYEMVSEEKETSSNKIVSENLPKPIIKKESQGDGIPKPKKEVVIEEEPVISAEVKPPLFSKVRGADSLRKIF